MVIEGRNARTESGLQAIRAFYDACKQ